MSSEKDPSSPPRGAREREEEEPHGHAEAPPATAHEIARRQLLGKMSIGLGVACGAAISVPGIGFVIAPLFRDAPREWRPVGKVSSRWARP